MMRLPYAGNEWPDPLASCAGYQVPTGPPIILELGRGLGVDGVVQVGAHPLSDGSQELDHCLLDAASYYRGWRKIQDEDLLDRGQPPKRGQEKEQQEKARLAREERASGSFFLGFYGAVIMVPRAPLRPGATYSVSITADSARYGWSFRVAAGAK